MAFGDSFASEMGFRTFYKVNADTMIEVAIVGDERVAHTKWTGEQTIVADKTDPEAKIRFVVNAYDPERNRIGIFEGSRALARAMDKAAVKQGFVYRIGPRRGQGKTTQYPIELIRPLSDDEKTWLEEQELHDLSRQWQPREDDALDRVKVSTGGDDIPF